MEGERETSRCGAQFGKALEQPLSNSAFVFGPRLGSPNICQVLGDFLTKFATYPRYAVSISEYLLLTLRSLFEG